MKNYEKLPTVQELQKINEAMLNSETDINTWMVEHAPHVKKFTINSDFTIDVDGDLFLSRVEGTLPVQFNEVKGDVDFDFGCSLTNLKGSPRKCGRFSCKDLGLTSLEGAPETVKSFNCSQNKLTNLKGSPKNVAEYFVCDVSKLTSLEGAPETVKSFSCKENNIVDLKGSPKNVSGGFDLSYNDKLTSLVGLPDKIDGYLSMVFCKKLTSLDGLPKTINGDVNCTNCGLKFPDAVANLKDIKISGKMIFTNGNIIDVTLPNMTTGGGFM